MANTLLQIGQALAIKANLDVPTTLTGNTERTAQLIYQCIKDGASKDAWHDVDWAVLRLEHTFDTDGSGEGGAYTTGGYVLPKNFGRFINNTIWDRTNSIRIEGPVTPEKWQAYKSGLGGLTGMTRICRIGPHTQSIIGVNVDYSRRLLIYPDDIDTTTNAAADPITVAFEYISKNFIVSRYMHTDELGSTWTTDNDYPIIDDDVIEAASLWRLLRTLGMSYADEKEEYDALISDKMSNDAGAETLSLIQHGYIFGANVPETGYGS